MRISRFTQMCVATTAVAGLVVGGASVASAADTPAGVQAIKDRAHAAITARVTKLHTVITDVQADTFLGGDQATLVTRLNSDVDGLTQLDSTIQADTTVATAKADTKKIFTDYRIYALEVPKARMVVAADAVQGPVATKLTNAATRLQAAITKRNATGQQATLDDMKAQIAAATAATSGTSAHLLTLTPADWNANHQVLDADRTNLKTARADLRTARQDAKTIVAALRQK